MHGHHRTKRKCIRAWIYLRLMTDVRLYSGENGQKLRQGLGTIA